MAVVPDVRFPFEQEFLLQLDVGSWTPAYWQRHSLPPLAASCIYLI